MVWYKVTFTSDEVHEGRGFALQKEFMAVFVKTRNTKKAVLFQTIRSADEDIEYYFSPAAAEISMDIISRYRGVACSAPEISELIVLVGNRVDFEST